MPVTNYAELSRFPNSEQIKACKALGLYQAISAFGEAALGGGVQDWYDQGQTLNPPPLIDTGRKKRWSITLPKGSPGNWFVFVPPGNIKDPIQPYVPGKPDNRVPGVGLLNKVTMSILSRTASNLLEHYAGDLQFVPRLDVVFLPAELCEYINFKGNPALPEVQFPLCQLIPDEGGAIDFIHEHGTDFAAAPSKTKYRANLPDNICMTYNGDTPIAFDLRTYQPPAAGGTVEADYPAKGMLADTVCREISKIFFGTDVVFANRPNAAREATLVRELFGR